MPRQTGFYTWRDRWVCAVWDGSMIADRTEQQGWETFTVEPQTDGTVAFKTTHGTHLCAELDGRMTNRQPDTDDDQPGPWERFRYERRGESGVVLETCHGTYLCAEGDDDYRFVHRTPGTLDRSPSLYETLTVSPWWASAYREPVGRIRLNGSGFRDDAGPFLGGTVSYFHGPRTFERDRVRFDADIATLQDAGADAVRIISDLGWPGDREQDGPGRLDRLLATMDALWAAGLRTQLTILGSLFGSRYRPDGSVEWRTHPYRLESQAQRRAYGAQLAEALHGREHQLLFVEVCNEPENGGVGPLSRTDMVELRRDFKDRLPGVLVALGAPGGHLGATTWDDDDYNWYGSRGDLVLPHLDRGGRDMGYGVAHQGIHSAQSRWVWGDNEPIGPRSSVRSESDATKLRLCRAGAWMCRAAFGCYHPYSGIGLGRDSDYPLRHEPGILTAFAARAVLPADLPNWEFHNWHWTTNPVETLEGCWADHPAGNKGTIRTLALTRGGRRVLWPMGIAPLGATLRCRESMALTWYQFEGDRYRDLGGADYRAGATIALPGGVGDVLLIGEAR